MKWRGAARLGIERKNRRQYQAAWSSSPWRAPAIRIKCVASGGRAQRPLSATDENHPDRWRVNGSEEGLGQVNRSCINGS